MVYIALISLLAVPEVSTLEPPFPAVIECTANTISINGGQQKKSEHPIVEALERAGPGTRIELNAESYPPFTIGFNHRNWNNARTRGGRPGLPVIVEGYGRATIRAGDGDSIAVDQTFQNGHITFRGINIHAGQRAGVMFFKLPRGKVHAGFTFEDCHIFGGYNHVGQRGRNSKWGVWGHQLRDFRFAGVTAPARVEGIKREHGFYIQNPAGKIVIENVRAAGLGRTFCQFTARAGDGAESFASIIVRNCVVANVGVSQGDGFKGGSAFTIAGRLSGQILLENNVYRAGFDKSWLKLTRKGAPYGTGALVAWQGRESVPNGTLILKGNEFRFAPGCGDRPVVAIGGCKNVVLEEGNVIQSGGEHAALALDPVDDNGQAISPPNQGVSIHPETKFQGAVTVGWRTLDEAGLRRLSGQR